MNDRLPCDRKIGRYTSRWEAEEALARFRRNWRPNREYNTPPRRFYQCPACGLWHLTHFAEGESPYEIMEAKDKARELSMMKPATSPATPVPSNEELDRTVREKFGPTVPVSRECDRPDTEPSPAPPVKTQSEKIREALQRRKALGLPVGRPKGVPVTEEAKANISEAAKRACERKSPNARAASAVNGFKPGHVHSEETLKKMREAWTPERKVQLTTDNKENLAKREASSKSMKERWARRKDRLTLGRLYLERLSELTQLEREVMLGLLEADGLGRQ